MNTTCTRRTLLTGCVAMAVGGTRLAASAAANGKHDPNLCVFLSDIHCNGKSPNWLTHQHAILRGYVDEILAMRPLPAHVAVCGDFSASVGWTEDFALAREILAPLEKAGIQLTLGMGNHDNRDNFRKVFPDYLPRLKLKDRIVSEFSTPNADVVMLDTLKAKPGTDGNFVEGTLDAEQRKWIRARMSSAKRPTFVCAHHSPQEIGLVADLVRAPFVYGYIFGHEHAWADGFLHDGYANSQTLQTATLPSSGFYGDVGYAIFRTFPDRAELTLRQTDFFFNRAWPNRPRPKNWDARVAAHQHAKITFCYDKPANFY